MQTFSYILAVLSYALPLSLVVGFVSVLVVNVSVITPLKEGTMKGVFLVVSSLFAGFWCFFNFIECINGIAAKDGLLHPIWTGAVLFVLFAIFSTFGLLIFSALIDKFSKK